MSLGRCHRTGPSCPKWHQHLVPPPCRWARETVTKWLSCPHARLFPLQTTSLLKKKKVLGEMESRWYQQAMAIPAIINYNFSARVYSTCQPGQSSSRLWSETRRAPRPGHLSGHMSACKQGVSAQTRCIASLPAALARDRLIHPPGQASSTAQGCSLQHILQSLVEA